MLVLLIINNFNKTLVQIEKTKKPSKKEGFRLPVENYSIIALMIPGMAKAPILLGEKWAAVVERAVVQLFGT